MFQEAISSLTTLRMSVILLDIFFSLQSLCHSLHFVLASLFFIVVKNTHCYCLIPKSCLILCDPMDFNLPGSSAHGISQAGILEWIAIPFSRGPSQGTFPGDPGIEPVSLMSLALAGGSLPPSHWSFP